jgi:hypothetical protein
MVSGAVRSAACNIAYVLASIVSLMMGAGDFDHWLPA